MAEHNEPDHSPQCRESRIFNRGGLLVQIAIDMTRGMRCVEVGEDHEEIDEAMAYLVDAIAKLAAGEENPRQMIEQIVMQLDAYPLEKLSKILREVEGL